MEKKISGFEKISDSISLIPQDPEIFNATIRENITIGIDYNDREIKKLTNIARFTEVVDRLPKGLESSIVEKGVNLSGGEKQRLALSRGLLVSKDKDIILLDELTSSIDFHNELAIYQNIFQTFKKQTIISAVHRLHLLRLFDTIHFFKEGKIIASGSFKELQTTSPQFKQLWDSYNKVKHG
jgi:ABC-type multidrug transport system fused ATPase/permease subunit